MALTLSGDTLFPRLHPEPPADEPFSAQPGAPKGRPAAGRRCRAARRGIGAGEDVGGAYRCGDRRAGRDGVSGRATQTRAAVRADGQVRYDIGKGVGAGLVVRERRLHDAGQRRSRHRFGGERRGSSPKPPQVAGLSLKLSDRRTDRRATVQNCGRGCEGDAEPLRSFGCRPGRVRPGCSPGFAVDHTEPASADLVGHDPHEPLFRRGVPREQRQAGRVEEIVACAISSPRPFTTTLQASPVSGSYPSASKATSRWTAPASLVPSAVRKTTVP